MNMVLQFPVQFNSFNTLPTQCCWWLKAKHNSRPKNWLNPTLKPTKQWLKSLLEHRPLRLGFSGHFNPWLSSKNSGLVRWPKAVWAELDLSSPLGSGWHDPAVQAVPCKGTPKHSKLWGTRRRDLTVQGPGKPNRTFQTTFVLYTRKIISN